MSRPPDPDRICGVAPVAALFARRPGDVLRLFHTQATRREAGPHCAVLARLRRPYREVPAEELARIAGTPHHGGIVAVAVPRAIRVLTPDDLPELLAGPVLPVLDGVGNPHNLGAIARTAAFFGCRALLLSGDPCQAGLSDAAYRTAEGGLEHLALFGTDELPEVLRALAARALTVAAEAEGGVPMGRIPRDRPIALVLGNEEHGPAAATLEACAARVTLRGAGAIQSLNVSNAAAILLHGLSGPA
ncbi:RNA methyltransferase [Roseomonas sp. NAR14]|uniref:RNA methyltransferase n=1 Tax=Roseomonas acroporae TaxID=2937791 RepID=A0A9X1Y818_9PROT|nr:RNA methyltransferase [Roseomonas acroporae]MCK8783812.1 RNA methyltransferase [Roseomonas acroporae]